MNLKKSTLKTLFLIFLATAVFCLCACKPKNSIFLSETEENAILPYLMWALVTVPYAPVRIEPDFASNVVSQVRKGDIYTVEGSKIVKYKASREEDEIEPSLWYKIEPGWIESRNISIYETKLKAMNAKN